MIMTLLGIQVIDFNNDSGEKIKGNNLYVSFEGDPNVVGSKTERIFVKDGIAIPKDIKLNEKLDISFTNKGRVEMINKIN